MRSRERSSAALVASDQQAVYLTTSMRPGHLATAHAHAQVSLEVAHEPSARQHLLDQHGALAELIEDMAKSERLDALARQVDQIAHEVGTPLSTLYGHLQLLLADPALPGALRPSLEVATWEAMRITGIVRRHLDSARALRPRLEPISLESFLSTLARESNALEGRERAVQLEIAPDAERPHVDLRTLRALVGGLIQNLVSRLAPDAGLRFVASRDRTDLVIRLEGLPAGAEPLGTAASSPLAPVGMPSPVPRAVVLDAPLAPMAVLEAHSGSDTMPPAVLIRIPAFALA